MLQPHSKSREAQDFYLTLFKSQDECERNGQDRRWVWEEQSRQKELKALQIKSNTDKKSKPFSLFSEVLQTSFRYLYLLLPTLQSHKRGTGLQVKCSFQALITLCLSLGTVVELFVFHWQVYIAIGCQRVNEAVFTHFAAPTTLYWHWFILLQYFKRSHVFIKLISVLEISVQQGTENYLIQHTTQCWNIANVWAKTCLL